MILDQNLRYYGFGLRVGVSNLVHNGMALGVRKTMGKILQPVPAYGRFPQHHFIAEKIERHLTLFPGTRAKILDVGSPKLLGLYLAKRYAVDVQLTDISHLNVDEYRLLWNSIKDRALGTAAFSLQDARALPYPPATFDVAYSMSVVEHVEGERGDSCSVSELIRVLKPGGLLLLTVPFGTHYVEQQRVGLTSTFFSMGNQSSLFEVGKSDPVCSRHNGGGKVWRGERGRGEGEKSENHRGYFFQRVYDQAACESRLLTEIGQLQNVSLITVYHRFPLFAHLWGCLGVQIRGVLGFANPWLSAIVSGSCEGFCGKAGGRYGPVSHDGDVFGHLMIAATKLCR
jgi:SAM-dependent methyltransferase